CRRRRSPALRTLHGRGKSTGRSAGCHTGEARLNRASSPPTRFPMSTLPTQMTAIGIKTPGGPEVLVPEERPVPKPGEGEILIRVRAAGVNRPDVMQRKGLYPPPPVRPT